MAKVSRDEWSHPIVWSALALFAVTLALCVLEVGLRVSGHLKSYSEKNFGRYVDEADSPFLPWVGFRGRPGERGTFRVEDRVYEYANNSLGFRDEEHDPRQRDGYTRIIGLGDSFTWGAGVPYEETYLTQLENTLNGFYRQGRGGKPVEILKCGLSGTDPVFALMLLERELLSYRPDIVILAVNDSDLDDVIRRGGVNRFEADGSLKPRRSNLAAELYRHSHLVRAVMALAGRDDRGRSRTEVKALRKQAQAELRKAFLQFGDLSDQHGFRLLIVVHPTWYYLDRFYGDTGKPSGDRPAGHALKRSIRVVLAFMGVHLGTDSPDYPCGSFREALCDKGIEFVDLLPAFRREMKAGTSVEQLFWVKQDFHCTARGYGVFARTVAEHLLSPPATMPCQDLPDEG